MAGGSAAQPYTMTVRLRTSRSGRAVSVASKARTMAGDPAHRAVTCSAAIISAMRSGFGRRPSTKVPAHRNTE